MALVTFTACKKSKYDGPSYGGRSFKQWYDRWSEATETRDKAGEKEARDAMKQDWRNRLVWKTTGGRRSKSAVAAALCPRNP